MTRAIDPELPWGCWLRIETDPSGSGRAVWVDDATGERWPSVRHAFWVGRLGMPLGGDGRPDEAMVEFLHARLAMLARRSAGAAERSVDLFGTTIVSRVHDHWLMTTGLVGAVEHRPNEPSGLTAEGWAALHMLLATRPDPVRQERPSAATVAMLASLGRGDEDRERRLGDVEVAASAWDVAFLRRRIGDAACVVLSVRGDGPMRARQTAWTLRLSSPDRRDAFYDWLCARLDRWSEWADIAERQGAERLTHHLLEVVAASIEDVAAKRLPA